MQDIKVLTFHCITDTNSYLLKTNKGFILIDTGYSINCKDLEKQLEDVGCTFGDLKLILLTHGHFDHTGNCAFLREKYGAQIAMHKGDLGMVEKGNLLYNKNIIRRALGKIMLFFLMRGTFEKFTPDILIEDKQDLTPYGLEAEIIHIPGHSKGSIGILTSNKDLICGDLLTNIKKPQKNTLIDNKEELEASVKKITSLEIGMVYPGHGKPFLMEQFIQNNAFNCSKIPKV
jgi:glyoxylase-like metal-dependent hydrolase (beta-lactamase superfamily II)